MHPVDDCIWNTPDLTGRPVDYARSRYAQGSGEDAEGLDGDNHCRVAHKSGTEDSSPVMYELRPEAWAASASLSREIEVVGRAFRYIADIWKEGLEDG